MGPKAQFLMKQCDSLALPIQLVHLNAPRHLRMTFMGLLRYDNFERLISAPLICERYVAACRQS